jgi:hypothetical protein
MSGRFLLDTNIVIAVFTDAALLGTLLVVPAGAQSFRSALIDGGSIVRGVTVSGQ